MKRNPVPVLTYHSVGNIRDDWDWSILTHPWQTFEDQMAALKSAGYRAIDLPSLHLHNSGQSELTGRVVALTFDDGYLDNWVYAVPLMRKYGMMGTVVVNPEFVHPGDDVRPTLQDVWDGKCHIDDLQTSGFMTWAELKAASDQGVLLAESHALTHTWYPTGPTVVDFHYPGDHRYWLDWNTDPTRKPRYLDDVAASSVPAGTPIYEHDKSLQARRYEPDQGETDAVLRAVRDAGEGFFERPDWREQLYSTLEHYRATHGVHGTYESDQDRLDRYRHELTESKRLIEAHVGKPADVLIWPGGGNEPASVEIAASVYKMTTRPTRDAGGRKNCFGEDPGRFTRIGSPYIEIAGDAIYVPGKYLLRQLDEFRGNKRARMQRQIVKLGILAGHRLGVWPRWRGASRAQLGVGRQNLKKLRGVDDQTKAYGRLLCVAYHFPPINSAGVARMVGFIKYLHRKGWKTTVVSVQRSAVEKVDPGTMRRIPADTSVYRTPIFETAAVMKMIVGRVKGTKEVGDGTLAAPALSGAHGGEEAAPPRPSLKQRVVKQIKRAGRSLYLSTTFPDKQAGWFWPLLGQTRRIMKQNRYDAVLSSSPPHSSHLVPAVLKSFYKFVWFADFRDGWTAPSYARLNPVWMWAARRLETFVLRRADVVVANTNGNRAELLKTFKFLTPEKVMVITNGYDATPVHDQTDIAPEDVDCDTIYLGEVYPEALEVLIDVFAAIKGSGERVPRLFIYGRLAERDHAKIVQAGLDQDILFRGTVSLDRSIAIMRHAPSLLLMLPHSKGGSTTVPSKLYAYMFSGSPMIALAPDGDAADIIEETGSGVVVKDTDPAAAGAKVIAAVKKIHAGEPLATADDAARERYTTKWLANRLHTAIEERLQRRG